MLQGTGIVVFERGSELTPTKLKPKEGARASHVAMDFLGASKRGATTPGIARHFVVRVRAHYEGN